MLNMFPSEAHYLTDEDTSLRIRQVTDAPCINHHPFFLIPAYDPAGRYLYFVSHRTGSPQLYAEDTAAHCILQLTDEPGLDEWSVHPCGDAVYFVAHGCAMRAFPHNGTVETLLTATEVHQRFHGVLGEGTTALTQDGHRWAIRIQQEHGFGILLWENGRWTQVYSGNMVAHLQFCPDDPDLLFFAGPLTDRVWVLDLAQGKAKRVFTRDAQRKQWITHESWIPGRRELSLVDWPHGIIAVNVDTSATRRVTTMNAWHAIANKSGHADGSGHQLPRYRHLAVRSPPNRSSPPAALLPPRILHGRTLGRAVSLRQRSHQNLCAAAHPSASTFLPRWTASGVRFGSFRLRAVIRGHAA